MRQRLWITFACILALTAAAVYLCLPSTTYLKWLNRDVSLRQGLDLKGGLHLVYEADTTGIAATDTGRAMEGVRDVIERRINGLGATEPDIRIGSVGNKSAVLIDLPGFKDTEAAKQVIGSTAKLTFRDTTGTVLLDGTDLRPDGAIAEPVQNASGIQQSNQWQVQVNLTSTGKDKFATATRNNVGKSIGIYLDEDLVSAPTVNEAITTGQAVISGSFTAAQAKSFAQQLNYGALPVPVNLVQEQVVGASLGSDAVSKSLIAGIAGIILIFVFMTAYYGWAGLLASFALIIYTLLNIAIFKLAPITLTLAGIAGFIISIGVAVDTNILTFERLKEELRMGKNSVQAVKESFRRSWSSIRDSHVAGLISAVIIFAFGSGSVRGFALVLIIGTLTSLFTTITVTRNWMLLVAGSRFHNLLAPQGKRS